MLRACDAVVFVVDAFAAENAATNSALYSCDVGIVVATNSQVGELTEAFSGRPAFDPEGEMPYVLL